MELWKKQTTTVSQKVPVIETSACRLGVRDWAAATSGAEPIPDSFEKSPRAIPNLQAEAIALPIKKSDHLRLPKANGCETACDCGRLNKLILAKARETRYNALMEKPFEEIIAAFTPSDDGRLDSLLKFTVLAEQMDSIARHTKLADGSRAQNDAEHSWRIALMALLFKEYFAQDVDERKAALLCLAHDLVEIYAGDTFAYDAAANVGKEEREEAAAQKLFGQLPDDIARKLRALWEEFEEFKTPESRYANCMDRLEPFLNNSLSLTGGTWAEAGATVAMVEKRIGPLKENMPRVWEWVQKNIERGKSRGFIKE